MNIWRPETYQGDKRKKHYFEGWYIKLIDKSRKTVIAIIPGISIGKNKLDSHSFVQFIDAVQGKTEYYRFPFEDFSADKNNFNIRIGPNSFSDNHIKVNLNHESTRIVGELHFDKIIKYPKSIFHPGIMGPFSFMPGMECYHGIVNISHTIAGTLKINDAEMDLTGGEGYIEKDWGRSFPKSWIWLQASHFDQSSSSFMFSVARVPWLGRSFTGLISFLKTENGFYNFSTYNGSKIKHLKIDDHTVDVLIRKNGYTLKFNAKYRQGGILKVPKNGLMKREIEESITAEIALRLADKKNRAIFEGTSRWVGMELSDADYFQVISQ
jgi:hypothetical protein